MSSDRLSLTPPYVPTRTLSQVVAAVFVLGAVVSWIAAGYDLGEIRVVSSIQSGESLEPAERLAHAKAGTILGWAQSLMAVFLAAAFLPWLYRMRANVRSLGAAGMRFRRGWTVLAFLIPGLNCWRPYQVVNEIWRASDPDARAPLDWQSVPSFRLVLAWWCALLAWLLLEALSGLTLQFASDLRSIQIAYGVSLVADACAAVSASLGYFLVNGIQSAQEAKAALSEPSYAPDFRGANVPA
ncbi:MAG: DUF4328 domain-containing protein [Myxococcota bacterium]